MVEVKLPNKAEPETVVKARVPKDEAFKADLLADVEKAMSLSRNPAVNRVLERMQEKLKPRSVPRVALTQPNG